MIKVYRWRGRKADRGQTPENLLYINIDHIQFIAPKFNIEDRDGQISNYVNIYLENGLERQLMVDIHPETLTALILVARKNREHFGIRRGFIEESDLARGQVKKFEG